MRNPKLMVPQVRLDSVCGTIKVMPGLRKTEICGLDRDSCILYPVIFLDTLGIC